MKTVRIIRRFFFNIASKHFGLLIMFAALSLGQSAQALMVGHVDSIQRAPNGQVTAFGWACEIGKGNVGLHFYSGSIETPEAVLVASGNAIRPSESTINATCARGKNNRFVIPINRAYAQRFAGRPVFIDLVNAQGKTRLSGNYVIPGLPISTRASKSLNVTNGPENTLNSAPQAAWRSGGLAPQWIEYDFGVPRNLEQITLNVIQSSPGFTGHQIFAGLKRNPDTLVAVHYDNTKNGSVIAIHLPAPVYARYLRIETIKSPALVGWGKVHFSFAPMKPIQLPAAPFVGKMFGYYATADDTSSFIPETAALGSNVAFLRPSRDTLRLVQEAAQHRMKAIVNVQTLFFQSSANPQLHSNYKDRFRSLLYSLRDHMDDVAGFYLIDEPLGMNKTLSAYTMKINMEKATALIHVLAPGKPVSVIYSSSEIRSSPLAFATAFPAGIDIIGVDCYISIYNPNSCSQIASDYHRIRALKRPYQKLMVVFDNWSPTPPTPDVDALLTTQAQAFTQLLRSPDMIGATAFLYQDGPNTTTTNTWWGGQSLPQTTYYFSSLFMSYRR